MKSRLPWAVCVLGVAGVAVAGCGRATTAAATDAEAATPRHVYTTTLTAQERTEKLRLVGTVEPVHDITLSAVVQGRIVERLADVGATVAEGEVLLRIEDTRIRLDAERAQAELKRLRAVLTQAQRDLTRAENLYRDKIASEDTVEAARTQVHINEAAVQAQRALADRLQQDVADTQVRSPVAGHVVERHIDLGELVSPGVPLMRVVDTSRIIVRTRVNEVDVVKVTLGATAHLSLDAYDGTPLTGTVSAIAAQADRATRTFPVEITLPNRTDRPLLAGMVARITLPGRRFSQVVVVPQDVIVERGGRRLAFVIQPDGTVAEREVTFGQVFGAEVIVSSGLAAGDEIVVRGQFSLNDGSRVEVMEQSS